MSSGPSGSFCNSRIIGIVPPLLCAAEKEISAHARATRKKTAHLKALRLAMEAETKTADPTGHPAKQTKRAPTARSGN